MDPATIDPHAGLTRGAASLRGIAQLVTEAVESDKPGDVLRYAQAIAREMPDLEAAAVATLRARGASWGDIGREYGVSRQAAQQRYGSAPLVTAVPEPEPPAIDRVPEPRAQPLTRQPRRALERRGGGS